MNPKASLILIPTPIDESSKITSDAFELLNFAFLEKGEKSIFAVEDFKPGRRRWLRYGLPREAIEHFTLFNEHTQETLQDELILKMKKGKKVYLMSDGGLPAFCDPGIKLVQACHQHHLIVSMTSFHNSSLAALVLSGFNSESFVFQGFLPKKGELRQKALVRLSKESATQVVMETPYRLARLLEEFKDHPILKQRRLAVALDINTSNEELHIGVAEKLLLELSQQKRAFVLVLDELSRG